MSDPQKAELQSGCNHEHDLKCPRCEKIEDTLSEIQQFIETTPFGTDQKSDEANYLFEKASESVHLWKQHQLRTIHQDITRSDIWEQLLDDEIYVVIDYAMKWLPTAGRESQQSWFGK